jgi:hypothetical protein
MYVAGSLARDKYLAVGCILNTTSDPKYKAHFISIDQNFDQE